MLYLHMCQLLHGCFSVSSTWCLHDLVHTVQSTIRVCRGTETDFAQAMLQSTTGTAFSIFYITMVETKFTYIYPVLYVLKSKLKLLCCQPFALLWFTEVHQHYFSVNPHACGDASVSLLANQISPKSISSAAPIKCDQWNNLEAFINQTDSGNKSKSCWAESTNPELSPPALLLTWAKR